MRRRPASPADRPIDLRGRRDQVAGQRAGRERLGRLDDHRRRRHLPRGDLLLGAGADEDHPRLGLSALGLPAQQVVVHALAVAAAGVPEDDQGGAVEVIGKGSGQRHGRPLQVVEEQPVLLGLGPGLLDRAPGEQADRDPSPSRRCMSASSGSRALQGPHSSGRRARRGSGRSSGSRVQCLGPSPGRWRR